MSHDEPHRYRAAIFDMDGVLISSSELHWYAFRETFRPLGIEFSWEHYLDVGIGAPRELVIRTVAGDSIAPDLLARLMAEKERHVYEYLAREGLDPIPGSLEFVRRVRARGLRTAVATASRTPLPFLEAIGARDLFEVVVDRTMAERPKPDPEIYRLTAERLRLAPTDCFVIEDSPTGVAAANAAGMNVVAITTTHGRAELSEASMVVDSFEEVSV